MINSIIKTIFWDESEKKVKKYKKDIEIINNHLISFENYTLDDVKLKTKSYQDLFIWLDFKVKEDNIKIKEILNKIKFEAFALVKQTCIILNWTEYELSNWKKETWKMIPYDVQLIGWLSLHDWKISEMKTWEWKTLVATIPAYLNALTWNTIHIVTVNDYLAKRDSEIMSILYKALWLKVWSIISWQNSIEKKEKYEKDIVYATNNELGFDYLRDNMVDNIEEKVQSPLFFSIIDEVDSILIDEARTPLIISAPDNEPTTKYLKFAEMSKILIWEDYKIDEKGKTATLTESWIKKIENLLKVDNIYISDHYNDLQHIENALKAKTVYIKDRDYLVRDWEIQIIDEHTWRVLSWRRYWDWLHQAIEAKEWVEIQQESKTLASITFQNYFRMYNKLSWMTWTAKTEEEEFYKVYWLETLVIPTNKPLARIDKSDLLFKNEKWKFEYVLKLIKDINSTWQPILVGTVSVEKSEYLSKKLTDAWIKHNVLNAKQHEKEAEVVKNAWKKGSITIATNMAWRWTDIKLGEGVSELGGLYIIWTEKHETRRIDNQLRWRAWRQWDNWTTQYLISPNDDIMRIFGWDKLFSAFNSSLFLNIPDDEPLLQSWFLTKKIIAVQKQVESHNFDARKNVLQYDDVINKHRFIIYERRNKILESLNIHENVKWMIQSEITKVVAANISPTVWEINTKKLIKEINNLLNVEAIDDTIEIDDISNINNIENSSKYIYNIAIDELNKIINKFIKIEEFYNLERIIVLKSIDEYWMNHIDSMSKLKETVAFEWYAQRDPLVVYKEKSYEKFKELIENISYKSIKSIYTIQINIITENKETKDISKIELNKDHLDQMEKILQELTWDKKMKLL